ncbi:MAG: YiiD C-terminal domain-containing protein [Gammaproteobacteria bacterium]|nr:YiiD C-terminal domain-containing protein [Gammaproteobacteria bacterium]
MTRSLSALCDDLQTVWHDTIPLTRALAIKVRSFDGETLEVGAGLAPNINLHGTAFAGSLYAISALCGWSMVHLQLAMRDLHGSIVLAEGRIRYLKPVAEEIIAVCSFGEQAAAFDRLKDSGKARFPLATSIAANGEDAALFEGEFGVKLKS